MTALWANQFTEMSPESPTLSVSRSSVRTPDTRTPPNRLSSGSDNVSLPNHRRVADNLPSAPMTRRAECVASRPSWSTVTDVVPASVAPIAFAGRIAVAPWEAAHVSATSCRRGCENPRADNPSIEPGA